MHATGQDVFSIRDDWLTCRNKLGRVGVLLEKFCRILYHKRTLRWYVKLPPMYKQLTSKCAGNLAHMVKSAGHSIINLTTNVKSAERFGHKWLYINTNLTELLVQTLYS
jgi:hypothetical protein